MCQPSKKIVLAVSIVTYKSDEHVLYETISSLTDSLHELISKLPGVHAKLCVVDNEITDNNKLAAILKKLAPEQWATVDFINGQGNVGYGRAHNLAIFKHPADYYLVLNPDVVLDRSALYEGLIFLLNHHDVGVIAPQVLSRNHKIQYLCKSYPAVFDLLLRGFMPQRIQAFFYKRLDRYELKDRLHPDKVAYDVPLISGCFMLFRYQCLIQAGGFSKRYFLYFEDYDLSLRIAKFTRLAYVPSVKIVHRGGYTARKGIDHILMFFRSMLTFYRRHGWRWI